MFSENTTDNEAYPFRPRFAVPAGRATPVRHPSDPAAASAQHARLRHRSRALLPNFLSSATAAPRSAAESPPVAASIAAA